MPPVPRRAGRLGRLQRRIQLDEQPERRERPAGRAPRKAATPALLHRALQRTAGLASQMVSKTQQDDLRQQLIHAGRPGGLNAGEFAALKILIALLMPAAGLVILGALRLFGLRLPLLFYLTAEISLLIAGYISVSFYLDHLVKQRTRQIQRALPDVLDLLTISVEAGLGLDQALYWVGRRFSGPLGEELVRVVQEIRLGRPRSEALRDLAERTQVEDLRTIARSIYQADRLGVRLGNVLRAQSESLREDRLMRGREHAQKVPVKMLVPMILFIFPSLFIVILGPAMIKTMRILQETKVFG